MRRTALIAVIFAHGWLTYAAWISHGYAGFFPPFTAINTQQIFSDLAIALTLVNVGVYLDLEGHPQRKLWVAVHVLGTLLAGSFAPLTYLMLRRRDQPVEQHPDRR